MSVAQRFKRALEPIAAMAFWAPETFEELAAAGVADPWDAYFVARAAPLGRAPADVVASAFYNWKPGRVGRSLRWDQIDPGDAWQVRVRAARRALGRLIAGDDGSAPDVSRAVALLREAVAACRPEGRTMFAAVAAMPWPGDDVADLWHGADLLREFRGDGHIVVLVAHDVAPIEAVLLHHLYVEPDKDFLLTSRAWTEEEYAAARARLAERGFVGAGGRITDAGVKFREQLESETDRLAGPPWAALGPEGCDELLALLEPLAARIVERRGIPRATLSFFGERPANAARTS